MTPKSSSENPSDLLTWLCEAYWHPPMTFWWHYVIETGLKETDRTEKMSKAHWESCTLGESVQWDAVCVPRCVNPGTFACWEPTKKKKENMVMKIKGEVMMKIGLFITPATIEALRHHSAVKAFTKRASYSFFFHLRKMMDTQRRSCYF